MKKKAFCSRALLFTGRLLNKKPFDNEEEERRKPCIVFGPRIFEEKAPAFAPKNYFLFRTYTNVETIKLSILSYPKPSQHPKKELEKGISDF